MCVLEFLNFSVNNNIHPAAANPGVAMETNRNVPSQPPRVNNSYPPVVENGPTSPNQSYHPPIRYTYKTIM